MPSKPSLHRFQIRSPSKAQKAKTKSTMQAYHKSQKAAQIKKSKQTQQKLQQEKLARRNPLRISRQIEELKSLESERPLRTHEQKVLKELEGELGRVRKAREALGIKDDGFEGGARGRGGGGASSARGGVGGRGRRYMGGDVNESDSDSSSSIASSVAEIPMPEGTPPPLPPSTQRQRQPHALPPKPAAVQAVMTYEAKPMVRDLRKEAAAFVPVAVKRRMVTTQTTAGEEGGKVGKVDGDEDEKVSSLGGLGMGQINAAPEIGKKIEVDVEYERFQREMEVENGGVEEGVGRDVGDI
ncbi:hypothetical protein BGX38DRAFT_1270175 [Terfezia claveryi]|nr:hypothetical protein BGX38DRAFT_1270175 [Terfezia claveryi]